MKSSGKVMFVILFYCFFILSSCFVMLSEIVDAEISGSDLYSVDDDTVRLYAESNYYYSDEDSKWMQINPYWVYYDVTPSYWQSHGSQYSIKCMTAFTGAFLYHNYTEQTNFSFLEFTGAIQQGTRVWDLQDDVTLWCNITHNGAWTGKYTNMRWTLDRDKVHIDIVMLNSSACGEMNFFLELRGSVGNSSLDICNLTYNANGQVLYPDVYDWDFLSKVGDVEHWGYNYSINVSNFTASDYPVTLDPTFSPSMYFPSTGYGISPSDTNWNMVRNVAFAGGVTVTDNIKSYCAKDSNGYYTTLRGFVSFDTANLVPFDIVEFNYARLIIETAYSWNDLSGDEFVYLVADSSNTHVGSSLTTSDFSRYHYDIGFNGDYVARAFVNSVIENDLTFEFTSAGMQYVLDNLGDVISFMVVSQPDFLGTIPTVLHGIYVSENVPSDIYLLLDFDVDCGSGVESIIFPNDLVNVTEGDSVEYDICVEDNGCGYVLGWVNVTNSTGYEVKNLSLLPDCDSFVFNTEGYGDGNWKVTASAYDGSVVETDNFVVDSIETVGNYSVSVGNLMVNHYLRVGYVAPLDESVILHLKFNKDSGGVVYDNVTVVGEGGLWYYDWMLMDESGVGMVQLYTTGMALKDYDVFYVVDEVSGTIEYDINWDYAVEGEYPIISVNLDKNPDYVYKFLIQTKINGTWTTDYYYHPPNGINQGESNIAFRMGNDDTRIYYVMFVGDSNSHMTPSDSFFRYIYYDNDTDGDGVGDSHDPYIGEGDDDDEAFAGLTWYQVRAIGGVVIFGFILLIGFMIAGKIRNDKVATLCSGCFGMVGIIIPTVVEWFPWWGSFLLALFIVAFVVLELRRK